MTNAQRAQLDRHLKLRLKQQGEIPYWLHLRSIASRFGISVDQVQDRLAELQQTRQPPVETSWNN